MPARAATNEPPPDHYQLVTAVVIALVLGIAYSIASHGSERSANGRAFKSASALVPDDAAGRRSAETAKDGAGLSIGT